MARTTLNEIEAVFGRLVDTLGVPKDSLRLSNARDYGGWVIVTTDGDNRPFGSRLPAKQFVAQMHAQIATLEFAKWLA